MKALVGPVRLMLLNCGKFEYAEVDLSAPLHLVGPNNVGKTSLIALLQLLYLDDQRYMHFARDMAETRRYYFPDQYSYALFECLCPAGFQVVGVRGLGPVRRYEFERFAYQGRLEPADFLDDGRRPWPVEETFSRLAGRGFVRMEPRNLRAALTGLGDDRGLHLGLVPARRSDTYERFRKLFTNVLRLSHIRQDELKELLLSVYESEFEQRFIDLAQNYATSFEKVQQDSREVQELKILQSDIEALLTHIEKRDACRSRLPGLWQAIGRVVEAARLRLRRREEEIRTRQQETQEQSEGLTLEIASARDASRATAMRLGEVRTRLGDLDSTRLRFRDFVPDWAEQHLRELQGERDEIVAQLGRAQLATPEQLERRIDRIGSRIDARRTRLRNIENALVQWLRGQLADDDIERLFAALNQNLLSLPVDTAEPGIRISDPERARDTMQELLAAASDSQVKIAGVEIDRAALGSVDLSQYGDKAAIERAIEELEAERREHEASLAAAVEAEDLSQRRERLETDIRDGEARLAGWRQLQIDEAQAEDWRRQSADLEAEDEELRERMARAEEERLECMRIGERLADDLGRVGQERSQIDETLRELQQPDEDWPSSPLDDLPDGLDELTWQYRRTFAEYQGEDGLVRETLDRIEARTYGRYSGEDEADTVRRLEEQLESIPARERAVRELWTSIAVGIKKSVSGINRDLEQLKVLVQQLNQQIARVPVSNLSSLRLIVDERLQWVKRIRGISLDEDMPLFADAGLVRESFEELGRLLSEHPRIGLEDLFDLHFEVGTPDGQTRRHAHLDSIESHGTTITIKVLTNLALLKGLLDGAEVRIPFYLDECSSLDSDNLAGIVRAAQDMGFVAVLASPDAMDAAARLYFLKENERGRVSLDPETALVEISEEPGDE